MSILRVGPAIAALLFASCGHATAQPVHQPEPKPVVTVDVTCTSAFAQTQGEPGMVPVHVAAGTTGSTVRADWSGDGDVHLSFHVAGESAVVQVEVAGVRVGHKEVKCQQG